MNSYQLTIAHRLAEHFGHDWATYLDPDDFRHEAISSDFLRGYVLAAIRHDEDRDESRWLGILGPTEDADGVVRHTTTTGRIRWAIHPDGAFEVWVARPVPGKERRCAPGVDVLYARIGPEEVAWPGGWELRAHGRPVDASWMPDPALPAICTRHVNALLDVLSVSMPGSNQNGAREEILRAVTRHLLPRVTD